MEHAVSQHVSTTPATRCLTQHPHPSLDAKDPQEQPDYPDRAITHAHTPSHTPIKAHNRIQPQTDNPSVDQGLGRVLGTLGRPMSGMGLESSNSAVNKKVHNEFQVDQHLRIEAAEWVLA